MDIKKVKYYVINTVIGILVLGIFSLIPFYYTTRDTQAQHSDKINNLAKEVKNLNDTIRDNEQAPIVIQGEIKAMKKNIENIEQNQRRQEIQLKKIYDVLLEIKTNDDR